MILGDNAGAISIITTPAYAWRSRHLKCRAGKLTELIEEEDWRLRRLPGTLLAADVSEDRWAFLEARSRGVPLHGLQGALWHEGGWNPRPGGLGNGQEEQDDLRHDRTAAAKSMYGPGCSCGADQLGRGSIKLTSIKLRRGGSS